MSLTIIVIISVLISLLVICGLLYIKILKVNDTLAKMNEYLIFQQTFNKEYEKNKDKIFSLINIEMILRTDYLLLKFSNNVKNNILFVRINLFRKIINCLIDDIIELNKKSLKKTYSKFIDKLKPKVYSKNFFVIYCCEKSINGVSSKIVNVLIDFMMFIHDYTSSKILDNIPKKIRTINKKNNDDNSNNSEKKTDVSFELNDLIDYIFNPYDIEKETIKMIKDIYEEFGEENINKYEEEKINLNNDENGNIESNVNNDDENNRERKGNKIEDKKILENIQIKGQNEGYGRKNNTDFSDKINIIKK